MSDSELSDAPSATTPPDAELESALRSEVVKFMKGGKDVTINAVRKAAEQQLGLSEGFYTESEKWKPESKKIIREEHESRSEQPSSPVEQKEPQQKTQATKNTKKRPSPSAEPAPKKRQKQSTTKPPEAEADSSALSEVDSEAVEEPKPKPSKPAQSKKPTTVKDDSDSELSVLLDEEPQPKKKRKSKEPAKENSKKSKANPKAEAHQDPNQEEIRKLQGWLAKCGVRKVWGKELKPYGSPKEKIKHLRELLANVGMTGRFSEEKARQIKDARELAADIEAVKEGNEMWGKTGDDEEGDGDDNAPRKRLVRGAKNYDFLSSDGEETD